MLLTAGALLVHGYHPAVEDAEIYLPGIKKLLDPALYPRNAEFFASHASRTFFPNLIAASVRLTHIPLDHALLLWHTLTIFLFLLACWRIGHMCFKDEQAAWGGTALVAGLLTLPVAGTALYILDQYLCTRSISTFSILFALISSIEGKYVRAALWFVVTALIHPLMVVYGLSYFAIVLALKRSWSLTPALALLVFPLDLLHPVSNSYMETLDLHPYFFLDRWAWYELLGAIAPLAILWWYRGLARRRGLEQLALLSTALVWFGAVYLVVSAVITIPRRLAGLTLLQPMRALHLLYIFFLIFTGGLLAQHLLKSHAWRWAVLFLPLCAGMFYAQREVFPATPHIEWPGVVPGNDWLRAFDWVRRNTPKEAFFALDPQYLGMPGEDAHGFRAIAERSRMADNLKDSGSVSMFPKMADDWKHQVTALARWREFRRSDFQQLHATWGVDWVLVARAQAAGLDCPYTNATLAVCRIY